MSSYSEKESIVCEKCRWVNILDDEKQVKRKKRNRMIYIDDLTFFAIKAYSVDFKSISNFLSYLVGIYQRDKARLNSATNMVGLE